MKKLLFIALFAIITFIHALTQAQVWSDPVNIQKVTGTGGIFSPSSAIVIVNGFPAFACTDFSHRNLIYFRANDSLGSTWANPIVVDFVGDVGKRPSLQIINGKPAITYSNFNGDLLYIQSSNITGTTWGKPTIIGTSITGSSGVYSSLQEVNGNPAIVYAGSNGLSYVRASDANGTTWNILNALMIVNNYTTDFSFKVINGSPAVSYLDRIGLDLNYTYSNDINGAVWVSSLSLDVTGNVGYYSSLELINGNPAISYFDATNLDLKYIRATNTIGSVWSIPKTVDATSFVGLNTSLLSVNGKPSIAYYDPINSKIKFVSSNDSFGNTWSAPLIIDNAGNGKTFLTQVKNRPTILYPSNNQKSKFIRANDISGTSWGSPVGFNIVGQQGEISTLQNVNGKPAICYSGNQQDDQLLFSIASNKEGSLWNNSVLVDSNVDVLSISIEMMNGKPIVSYWNSFNNLRFVRSLDSSGTIWDNPVSINIGINYGRNTSLKIINGNPAIAYRDNVHHDLMFVRANDVLGNTWGNPVIVDSLDDRAYSLDLEMVNGKPAISYNNVNGDGSYFIRSLDANGTSWGNEVLISTTGYINTSMKIVDGRPAIAISSAEGLIFVHANDINGTTWNPLIKIDSNVIYYSISLENINGHPAIAYFDLNNSKLKYIRSNNNVGSLWPSSIIINTNENNDNYSFIVSMKPIGDDVGLAYFNPMEGSPFYISGKLCVPPLNAVVVVAPVRCGKGNALLEVSFEPGTTADWYAAPTGGLPLRSGSQYYTAPGISSTTTYYVETRNKLTGCVSNSRTAITASVNPRPFPPSTTGASLCGIGSVRLSANANVGETIDWYDLASGGTLLFAASDTFRTPILSGSKVYYAQTRNITTGCVSLSRTFALANIGIVIDPVVVNEGSRCGSGRFVLEVFLQPNTTNDWYTTPTGGTPIRSNSLYFTTPILTSTTIYYAEARNRISGCLSNRTPVTVVINPLPALASVTPASLCGAGSLTLNAAVPAGITTDWYSAAIGGTLLASSTSSYTTPVLNSSTTYFVQSRNETTGCLSKTRAAVTATVGIVNPPTAVIPGLGGPATRCGAGKLTLEVSSPIGTRTSWYAAPSGGIALRVGSNYFTTPVISSTTTYYAEAVNSVSGCASSRIAVTATVDCPPPRMANTTFSSTEASLFPNPNNGLFTISIKSTDVENSATIQIRDISGRLIFDQLNNANVNGSILIDINQSNLPSGFYTMNYFLGSETGSVKFVVVQ